MIRFSPRTSSSPVLAIDTCASKSGAALYVGSDVVAEGYLDESRPRGEAMAGLIEALLAEGGVRAADLEGLGVVNGPGSYTGLRVGLALARGLALVDDLPVAAIGSLELAAIAAADRIEGEAVISAVLDAGRGKAFEAVYGKRDHSIVELGAARACTREDLDRSYADADRSERYRWQPAAERVVAVEEDAETGPDPVGSMRQVSFPRERAGALVRAAAAQLEDDRGRECASILPLYVGAARYRRQRGGVVPQPEDEK